MRRARQVLAFAVVGLSLAVVTTAATTATAAPKPSRVAPKGGKWKTTTTGCPGADGKVQSKSTASLQYPTSLVHLGVFVTGYVNDSAALGSKLQVQIRMTDRFVTKEIVHTATVTTSTNGVPAFPYTLGFPKTTTAFTRKEVAAEVADALSLARKQEVFGRNQLFKAQKAYWGSPGQCVTAKLDPNNFSAVPGDSATTTGSLESIYNGGLVAANWSLVKTDVGKLSNTTQKKQVHPDFPWTAAAKADASNQLVRVKLLATSKQGLDDVTFIVTKELGKVHVEMDLAYVRTWPAYPDNSWDLSGLNFGATLSFDATELPGLPGAYALDSDANWSFPVQSASLSSSQDCVSTAISYLGTSPYGLPATVPDHPKGDYDVIQQEPDGQWRMTPSLNFTAITVEAPPATSPYNCKLGELISENMRGQVSVPPGYGSADNFLDTFIPNGPVGQTQTVKWTRDLANLDQPLGFGDGLLSATVNVTPLPNPTP